MRQVAWNDHRTRPFWYINPKKFNRFHKIFIISVVFYFLFWKYTKIPWKVMIDKKFTDCFQISWLANIPKKGFSTQNGPLDIRFQMSLTPTMGAFYFLRNLTETMVQSFNVFSKDCSMVFAWLLTKFEASMVGVCLIWNLISKGPFWVLNFFWGIFAGQDIQKPILIFFSIINFQCIFKYFQNQR